MEMSLNRWVAETGLEREDCFKHGYRELYLDIGFFNAKFAGVEFVINSLLLLAAESGAAPAIEALVGSIDIQAKLDRFRRDAAARGAIGPNLAARLGVFETQSIPLRDKLKHSAIVPGDDWPDSYEFFSALEHLKAASGQPDWAEPSENMRADRIWKHGIWLHNFLTDLGTVGLTWTMTGAFEIAAPRTPVLEPEGGAGGAA